ncbi:MAG: hypothetical protein AB7R89_12205 [Dehalococcoidia bacterium]
MSGRLPDFIPNVPSSDRSRQPGPARHGGRRPGSGAKPGNLNALKHGRYSRFKDALPPEPFNPAVVARSLLLQQRTEAERIAASLLRVVLEERFKRDLAAAVAERRPVPPPPLLTASRRDHARVRSFLSSAGHLATLQRAAAEGRIAPDNPAVAAFLRAGESLESVLPTVAHLLERAAAPPLPPDAVARLLRNETGNDQAKLAPIESTVQAFAALDESAPPKTRKTIRSSATRTPNQDTIAALRTEAAALVAELAASTPPRYTPP